MKVRIFGENKSEFKLKKSCESKILVRILRKEGQDSNKKEVGDSRFKSRF